MITSFLLLRFFFPSIIFVFFKGKWEKKISLSKTEKKRKYEYSGLSYVAKSSYWNGGGERGSTGWQTIT